MTNKARHRNGVCGLAFEAEIPHPVTAGEKPYLLTVQFDGQDHRIMVNLNDVKHLTDTKGKTLGRYRDAWSGLAGYVRAVKDYGDCWLVYYTDKKQRFLGVLSKQGHSEQEPAFAVFDLDLLPDLTFGVNSWRGDRHYGAIKRYIQ